VKGIEKDLLKFGRRLAIIAKDETKAEIIKQGGYSTGTMFNKTQGQAIKIQDGVIVELGTNAVSDEDYNYADVYEKGREAGKGVSEKGQESIVKWIKIKIRQGKFSPIRVKRKTKRMKLTTAQRKENVIKGIAFIISQNIKKNGLKGHFVFKHGFNKMLDSFESELGRIMGGLEF